MLVGNLVDILIDFIFPRRCVSCHTVSDFICDRCRQLTAFPPEPSKYPHIGHAKAIIVNYELAKRHNGTYYLRFEDTNPKIVEKEFYKVHLEGYSWLGIKADKVEYASDFMDVFYNYAEKLIKKIKYSGIKKYLLSNIILMVDACPPCGV